MTTKLTLEWKDVDGDAPSTDHERNVSVAWVGDGDLELVVKRPFKKGEPYHWWALIAPNGSDPYESCTLISTHFDDVRNSGVAKAEAERGAREYLEGLLRTLARGET